MKLPGLLRKFKIKKYFIFIFFRSRYKSREQLENAYEQPKFKKLVMTFRHFEQVLKIHGGFQEKPIYLPDFHHSTSWGSAISDCFCARTAI